MQSVDSIAGLVVDEDVSSGTNADDPDPSGSVPSVTLDSVGSVSVPGFVDVPN